MKLLKAEFEKIEFRLFLFCGFIELIVMILINNRDERRIDKKIEEYPIIYKYTRFAGKVKRKEIEESPVNKGILYIDLLDNIKFSLNRSSYNENYDPSNLNNFLQQQDSIVKHMNSDTIYIYRNQHQYYFVYGEYIKKNKFNR